jgi:hypothetical protein
MLKSAASSVKLGAIVVMAAALMSLALVLAGCSSSSTEATDTAETETTEAEETATETEAAPDAAATEAADYDSLSEEELATVVVDEEARTVSVYGAVNAKYFTEPTHHFLVNKDGSNGDKCILRAWATPADFYEAMLSLGATPGDNLTKENADGRFVEGTPLEVTVSWDGSDGEVPIGDCIKTQDGSPYEVDERFGGMMENNNEYGSGCINCTFSCWVGISSNGAYAYNTDDVLGNGDVLPADGTICKVTFKVTDGDTANNRA